LTRYASALNRTQNVLYVIGRLKQKGVITADTTVYVDSATAKKITRIYRKYKKYYSPGAYRSLASLNDPLTFPYLHEISSGDALIMHERGEAVIYISSNAILDHANAPKHLEKMIEDQKNLFDYCRLVDAGFARLET
jgi:metallo-beta-lactamase family protein